MLPADETHALSQVRLSHAEQCLASAKTLQSAGDYKGASNRAYYAVFHAMRAVLSLDGVDMKHHSGIISEFRKRYIKTGLFDAQLSEIIQMQSEARSSSDYDDFFVISKEEVIRQISGAEIFTAAVIDFLTDR